MIVRYSELVGLFTELEKTSNNFEDFGESVERIIHNNFRYLEIYRVVLGIDVNEFAKICGVSSIDYKRGIKPKKTPIDISTILDKIKERSDKLEVAEEEKSDTFFDLMSKNYVELLEYEEAEKIIRLNLIAHKFSGSDIIPMLIVALYAFIPYLLTTKSDVSEVIPSTLLVTSIGLSLGAVIVLLIILIYRDNKEYHSILFMIMGKLLCDSKKMQSKLVSDIKDTLSNISYFLHDEFETGDYKRKTYYWFVDDALNRLSLAVNAKIIPVLESDKATNEEYKEIGESLFSIGKYSASATLKNFQKLELSINEIETRIFKIKYVHAKESIADRFKDKLDSVGPIISSAKDIFFVISPYILVAITCATIVALIIYLITLNETISIIGFTGVFAGVFGGVPLIHTTISGRKEKK